MDKQAIDALIIRVAAYEERILAMEGHVFYCEDNEGALRRWYPPRVLPALPPQEARPSPKVRKLVWKRVADNSWVSGSYTITEKREKFNVTFYTGPVQGLMSVGMRESLESAKAAAQADYEARILGALE